MVKYYPPMESLGDSYLQYILFLIFYLFDELKFKVYFLINFYLLKDPN